MMRSSIIVLVIMLMLVGCKPAIARAFTPPPASPTEHIEAPSETAPPLKTADDWRAQKQKLLDQIDENNRDNSALLQQITTTEVRAKRAEQEAQLATARTQAAWGRRIAFLCFALSVAVTVISFLPFGALIPKWAGPAGIGAGIAILVAAQVWVWVFDHLIWFSLSAAGIGGLIVFLTLIKGTTLLRIRQTFTHAMETATSEADELNAKATSLAAELDAGVHKLGQRLRGKPLKTWDDVLKLNEAAQDKTRTHRIQPTATPIR